MSFIDKAIDLILTCDSKLQYVQKLWLTHIDWVKIGTIWNNLFRGQSNPKLENHNLECDSCFTAYMVITSHIIFICLWLGIW